MRREKVLGLQWVQFPPGNWAAPAGSYRGKSGVSSSFWEIRCQFIILARKDELTPDYAQIA